METKKILGLDIGTNSIGGALITLPAKFNDYGTQGSIDWIGSRIIPFDFEYTKAYEKGQNGSPQVKTPAANRRTTRGSRRLKHRYKQRRNRLIAVFKILGWVEEDFPLDNSQHIKNTISENGGRFQFKMKDWLPFSEATIGEATTQLGVAGKTNANGNPIIPEDWIIYYLRKKALSEIITVKELARLIYMLNQRRGFKSSRKDLKEIELLGVDEFFKLKKQIDAKQIVEYSEGTGAEKKTRYVSSTIVESVTPKSEERDAKGKLTFIVAAADKRIQPWEVKRKEKPDWQGKEVKLLVEQRINRKGEVKQDSDPKLPEEDDWNLIMISLDNEINKSGKHVGEFFWDKLVEHSLKQEVFKIRQNVVRREKYEEELKAIWEKQLELREKNGKAEELLNTSKLHFIAETLYRNNTVKQKQLHKKGLYHILSKDIIYYQRDLKSQKGSISECRYERRKGKEKNENGEWIETGTYGLKCAPKSSPTFQEFRIWQDVHNIRIFENERIEDGKVMIDVDVTQIYLPDEKKDLLFDLFDSQSEITEDKIFRKLNSISGENKLNGEQFRINLFANRDNKLKGNETKDRFRKLFKKHGWEKEGEKLLSHAEDFYNLWHILYSISSSDLQKSQKGIRKALKGKFSHMPENIVEALTNMEEFKKEYASYSALAIRKLLTLLRCGKHWHWEDIEAILIKTPGSPITENEKISLSDRVDDIIKNGWERDTKVDKRTGEIIERKHFTNRSQFSGLPVWMAGYVVYGRHSERENTEKYGMEDIDGINIRDLLEPGSLRNPLAEGVIRETLHLVKDICKAFGQPDEIHIELGRDLKKNSEQRQAIARSNAQNLEEKLRAKKLLSELLNGTFEYTDENEKQVSGTFFKNAKPNPGSPVDIEKFRLYKSCGQFDYNEKERMNQDQVEMEKLFRDGKKERIPTNTEVKKYILWLSQRCRSPYTGKIIPIAKLFDENSYQKEHIIPQSRMKYDSMDNLVMAEAGVNQAKGQKLAVNFIADSNGTCSHAGKTYSLLKYDDYVSHCKTVFKGKKLKNLLATVPPDDFIERQINDTRYIGRKLGELLYPFTTKKNRLANQHTNDIVFTIGSITSDLKSNWGLNKVWKQLIKSRFERLQKITGNTYIQPNESDKNDIDFNVREIPDFDSKRIDHRHHALDALIIAATTWEHIRYLNTLNAADSNEDKKNYFYTLCKGKVRDFKLPWNTFAKDAKAKLEETVVTFKSKNKLITRPYNRYLKWIKKQNGELQKLALKQKANSKWMAVRKSLFKIPQGIVWIKEKKEVAVKKAFRIQIERMQVEHDKEKRRFAPYIYDQAVRPFMKQIIEKTIEATGMALHQTKELLAAVEKEYLRKNKIDGSFMIGGQPYNKIRVALFTPYKAKRVAVDKSFDHEKIILNIPNSEGLPIAKIMHEHLADYESKKLGVESFDWKQRLETQKQLKKTKTEQSGNEKKVEKLLKEALSEAYSEEGLEKLAKKNGNKPIRRITVLDGELKDEHRDNLFGNKYMETDAGAIAHFVIYENEETKERSGFISIPAHKVVERLKKGLPVADKRDGFKTIVLQPNDLVYVPTDEEWERLRHGDENAIDWSNRKALSNRIYKMVSADDAFFIHHHISRPIIPTVLKGESKTKGEIDWHNKSTKMMDGKTNIAERCIKLHIDRLGNIIHFN